MVQYVYDINPTVTDCKYWGYVIPFSLGYYPIILNTGDSIVINQTTAITTNSPVPNGNIDVIQHQMRNICGIQNSGTEVLTGSFICKVDGVYALPTIGKITYGPVPIYVAYPPYGGFNTDYYFTWDTSDVVKKELTTYEYIWQGSFPITIKTWEYYVVVYHGM